MGRICSGVCVRALYALILGLITTLVVVMYEGSIKLSLFWALGSGAVVLFIEWIVTLKLTRAYDWRWCSPCTIIFSVCSLAAVWMLQLRTLAYTQQGIHVCVNVTAAEEIRENLDVISYTSWMEFCACGHCNGAAEQLLLITLLIGRFFLPRGGWKYNPEDNINNFLRSICRTHFILTIACNGADAMDMISYSRFPGVSSDVGAVRMILIVFSMSVAQFSVDHLATIEDKKSDLYIIVETDLWSSLLLLFTNDLPALCMRVYVVVTHKAFSPFGVFFIFKNLLFMCMVVHKVVILCTGKDLSDVESYVSVEPYSPSPKPGFIDTPNDLDSISDSDDHSEYSNEIPVQSRNEKRRKGASEEWGSKEDWFNDSNDSKLSLQKELYENGEVNDAFDIEAGLVDLPVKESHTSLPNDWSDEKPIYFTEAYANEREARMEIGKVGAKKVIGLPLGAAWMKGHIDFSKVRRMAPAPATEPERTDSVADVNDENQGPKKHGSKDKENDGLDVSDILNEEEDELREKKKHKKRDKENDGLDVSDILNEEEDELREKKKHKKRDKERKAAAADVEVENTDVHEENQARKKHKKRDKERDELDVTDILNDDDEHREKKKKKKKDREREQNSGEEESDTERKHKSKKKHRGD